MTIELTLYASILLVFRAISMTFIFLVLRKQWALFKLPIKDQNLVDTRKIKHFRNVLFFLALIVFAGNIVPAVLDFLAIIGDSLGRPNSIPLTSLTYTLSASLTSLASSYLIWRLYRLAADEEEITDLTIKTLKEED